MILFAWFFMLCIFCEAKTDKSLPNVENNSILETESAIRITTNELFATFNFKTIHDKPKLKQYSSLHKYFISLTLQDNYSLKEIAELTRINKTQIGLVIIDFITSINEIFEEENVISTVQVIEGKAGGNYNIDEEISKIEYNIKNLDMDPNAILDINKQILKILEDDDLEEHVNGTEMPLIHLNNDVLADNDSYWRPDEVSLNTRRIYGGYPTKITHYPFMASVQIFGKFQCASSLIQTDLALTSAGCLQLAWNNRFYRENPAFLSIRVGSSFFEGEGESIPVLETYFHPRYNPRNLNHNLAIMRTVRHIRWHNRVKRIQLDTVARRLPLTVDGIVVVGWGAMTQSNRIRNPIINKIHYSVLDIYPLDDCQKIYSREFVTRKHFCAGYLSKGEGACNKDAGGPGIVHGYLAGVISFSSGSCGTPDTPTVFTKVGFYRKWIESIMEQDVPIRKGGTTTRKPRPHINLQKPPKTTTVRKIPPIHSSEHTTMSEVLLDEVVETEDKKKTIKEKQIFKMFLKTMLNSDEINTLRQSIKKDDSANVKFGNMTSTTEEPIVHKPATVIADFDNPPLNSSEEEASCSDEQIGGSTLLYEVEATIPSDKEIETTTLKEDKTKAVKSLKAGGSNIEFKKHLKALGFKDDNIDDDYKSILDLDEESNELTINKDELINDALPGTPMTKHRLVLADQSPDSTELKNQAMKHEINEAMIYLLNVSRQQDQIDAGIKIKSQESGSEGFENEKQKMTKTVASFDSLSSDYETEAIDYQIPVRSTALLESFEDTATAPTRIFPKVNQEYLNEIKMKETPKIPNTNQESDYNDPVVPFFPNVSFVTYKPMEENMPLPMFMESMHVFANENRFQKILKKGNVARIPMFSKEDYGLDIAFETTMSMTPANFSVDYFKNYL